jgi:hypothetical protein
MAKHFDNLTDEQVSSLKLQLSLVRAIAKKNGYKRSRVRKLAKPTSRTLNFDSMKPAVVKQIVKDVKRQLKHAGMPVLIRGDMQQTLIVELQVK